jgi:hypothetical protein
MAAFPVIFMNNKQQQAMHALHHERVFVGWFGWGQVCPCD